VAGAGVGTAIRAVVVRAVAGPVVVVVAGAEEVLAPVAIADEGVTLGGTRTERDGDRVALGVGSAHRLAPVAASHGRLLSIVEAECFIELVLLY
jgi:hypothetical protein